MRDDLFAALRDLREGSQFERFLRVLWFLFDDWCTYNGVRKLCDGEDSTGHLRAIYFDKFAVLVARFWDAMFRRTGQKLKGKLEEADGATLDAVVASPCPFREVPGKHGRGLARWDGKLAPRFLVDLLYQLRQEKILYYFDIEAPYGPGDYRTVVKSGTPITNRTSELGGFTSREKTVLLELTNVLKKLGPGEIRALGTHSTVIKAIEDIEKEFEDLERLGVWDRLLGRLEQGMGFSQLGELLLEYAEEAWRKAAQNEDDYKTARKVAMTEATSELQSVILECQGEANTIWQDSKVKTLASRAKRLLALAKYVWALGQFGEHPRERSGMTPHSRAWKRWDESCRSLSECGFTTLPTVPSEAFDGDSEVIRASVRESLTKVLKSVRLEEHGS